MSKRMKEHSRIGKFFQGVGWCVEVLEIVNTGKAPLSTTSAFWQLNDALALGNSAVAACLAKRAHLESAAEYYLSKKERR
jgi:hypothetical protein